MESTLLALAICLMFNGVFGESESMSCSTINGETICNRQKSQGNTAMSSSQAALGPGFTYQDSRAMAGNPENMGSSSQTVYSGSLPGGFNNPSYGFQAPSGIFGGNTFGSSSYSSYNPDSQVAAQNPGGNTFVPSSYSSYNPDTQVAAQNPGGNTFVPSSYSSYNPDTQVAAQNPGGYNSNGFSYTSSSSSSLPNQNFYSGPQAAVGGFGFASAGSFPVPPFPGFGYPPQESSRPSGNPPNSYGGQGSQTGGYAGSYSSSGQGPQAGGSAGSYAGGFAGGFNPFQFVFGPNAGAGFPGVGAFAFGRR